MIPLKDDNPTSGRPIITYFIIGLCTLIFLVQIQNMENFKIAKDIDEEYYKNYLLAKKAGVNFLAYRCRLNLKEIRIEKKLKIINE